MMTTIIGTGIGYAIGSGLLTKEKIGKATRAIVDDMKARKEYHDFMSSIDEDDDEDVIWEEI